MQLMPDRPFQGHPLQEFRSQHPQAPMIQTPPDRPVQQRAPAPPPPAPVQAEVEHPIPEPVPRQIHPPVLMFNSTPESELIEQEFQLNFLLDDIAAWGPEKVERVLRFTYPPFKWRVAVFDEFVNVIQCPTEEWLTLVVRKK